MSGEEFCPGTAMTTKRAGLWDRPLLYGLVLPRGQAAAKRALTVAAAGHHNMLMIGPPGSGKTVYKSRQSCRRSYRAYSLQ